MAKNLVIVESPAKAKTIEKYLGSDYEVLASMGHLRDLPKSKLGVDIENNFEPEYIPVKERADIIEKLKKKAKSAPHVYLATDPDREGEAISWHLKEMLAIPDAKASRVTFNEITRKVVQAGIASPRDIDRNLVDAQQARRVLDRIVGYKISPLLWRKIRRGLSAGRVQSVAVRLVVDRENEITDFVPEEYWHLDARLGREGKEGTFTARYFGSNGKKCELHSAAEVQAVSDAVQSAPWTIESIRNSVQDRSPAPPFITSTLQQEASRRLGMTPRRCMSIAQQLYEGIDITGEGTVGLITYMRTDSLRLSEDALAAAGGYIREHYGEEYYSGPRRYKTKSGAQDAHEAIRPSNVLLTPEQIRGDLTPDQYRLYRLIWGRFLSCQMANVRYDKVTITALCGEHSFKATNSTIRFPGFTKVYEDKGDEEEGKGMPLPDLQEGETVLLQKLDSEQQFTQPPARYTEATLIRALEEKGIGRPSTYAPTITTISSHEYVVKEGKYLKPTPLGTVVNTLMAERFPDIVDTRFTANMESRLDDIEKGEILWKRVLSDFYGGFADELSNAEAALDGQRIKVPAEESDEICDKCGRKMVVKSGRFGRFLACPGFPECDFTKPLVIQMPGACPKCGSRILKRTSARGYTYYACERRDDCGFMTWDIPVKDECPACGKSMFKLSGKGARKPFCENSECEMFVPEDKRGYRKKKEDTAEGSTAETKAMKKPAEKKTTAAKKTAAKKTAAKKTTSKKTSAAKKTTAKTASKKTAAVKATEEETAE